MKKIASILLMLTCIIGLTACGEENTGMSYDENAILEECEWLYNGVTAYYSDEKMAEFDSYTVDEYDEYSAKIHSDTRGVYSKGIRIDGQVLVAGMHSWQDSLEEIGTIVKHGENPDIKQDITIDAKDDELFVSIAVDGTIHDAVVEIIYDKNFHVTNITTNVVYSFKELMVKAGVNTLIGMGTVFAVLILISLIIGCFGLIPKIQASMAEKKRVKEAAEESVDNAIAGIIEREEVSDDCELIAVIAAAIAASEGASSTDGFVVRSIKRIR